MARKLTKAQRRALASLDRGFFMRGSTTRQGTMEALRRRGLAERHSFFVTKAYYANQTGEHRQRHWTGWLHEWFITPAGHSALQEPADG